MRTLVFADVHAGQASAERLTQLQNILLKYRDYPMIWNGDIYDLLVREDSYLSSPQFIKDDDLYIVGNHDYGLADTRFAIVHDKVFVAHGDLLDFGFGFALLEHTSPWQLMKAGLISLALIVKFLQSKRKWTEDDVYDMYRVMLDLSDVDVQAFHNRKSMRLSTLIAYYRAYRKLLKYPSRPSRGSRKLYGQVFGSGIGLTTSCPKTLLERVLLMYPEAADCSTIVIGHLHFPSDSTIWASNGKAYRFVTLGAWVGPKPPSFVEILSSGSVLVHNLES